MSEPEMPDAKLENPEIQFQNPENSGIFFRKSGKIRKDFLGSVLIDLRDGP